ncbi:MAG: hypothetical protein ACSLFQ_23605 [Thermoanaerobaculia bacterium]
MRHDSNRAARLLLLVFAGVFLPGYVQIRDVATIRGSGSAVAKRTVTISGADDLDRVLALVPERERGDKQRRKLEAEELKTKICEGLTKDPKYWELCRWEGNALIVEKSWSKRESPFSSAHEGQTSFALHHWLGNEITRPPFPLIGVGPIMQDDKKHRDFIRDLREKGFVLELKIIMPGEIRMLWGENVTGGLRTVTIDLLEEWPQERQETFIMSEGGLLYSPVFHAVIIFILTILGIIWVRRAKRDVAGF